MVIHKSNMKELLIKLWESLPPRMKKNILPLLLAATAIAVVFSFVSYFELNKEEVLKVSENPFFQVTVLIVVLSLTIYYLKRILSPYLKPSYSIFIISIIVTVELAIAYNAIQNKISKINVNVYQIDSPNFKQAALKYCLQEINKESSFQFIYKTETDIVNTTSNDVHSNQIFLLMHNLENYNKSEINIALISKMLFTNSASNLFAVCSQNEAIVSTYDWNFSEYQSVSIYKYIITEMIEVVLVSSTKNKVKPIKFHSTNSTLGCVFDYNYNKNEIIQSILSPNICDEHKKLIEENYGEKGLKDVLTIFKFDWLKTIRPNLQKIYGVQI